MVSYSRIRTSILDTRVTRGAEIHSNHFLVRTRIRLTSARADGKKRVRERFNVRKLER